MVSRARLNVRLSGVHQVLTVPVLMVYCTLAVRVSDLCETPRFQNGSRPRDGLF